MNAIQKLIDAHNEQASNYRALADAACRDHDAFGVWWAMNAMMAEERKARALKQRYRSE